MLTLPLLRKMLNRAGTELKANSKYLCELDSVAGDGDHGITIGRMADVMKEKTEDTTIDTMRVLLDELGDAFMGINGGSAGPLWGTVFTGMAEGIDDQAELTDLELRKMFTQAKEDFMDISKAKPGDKTMVDALYPAIDAIIETQGSLKEIMTAAAAAALFTLKMACRFGRTRIIGNTVQILIRQHALCQWREGDHPYSFLLQQRQQVRFDPAIQHRITRLMDQARHTMFFQYGKCFFRLSGSVIRYPDIQGFSLADDISQCSHRFFDRRLWVRTMRIENIHIF